MNYNMKKIESLVKQYDKAIEHALSLVENIKNQIVFNDFKDDEPKITVSQEGVVANWKGIVLSMDDVIMIMKGRGYIEPNDFEIFGY